MGDPAMGELQRLPELGFYALAGHASSPRDIVDDVRLAEALGLGSGFVSERFDVKDACTLSGAVAALSEHLGVATAATNHTTRHPVVTATFATTMARLTDGRFALGLGRGFDGWWDAIGLPRITMAQMEDFIGIMRTVWSGEPVIGHDGPAGSWPVVTQFAPFGEQIPILLVALGLKTLEFAGRVADAVVLHTFFSDEALANSVAAVRRGAEAAGRDPSEVRVWSVLATVGDHIDEELRLRKLVGRLATYLQGYGDVLATANGWDPADLARVRESDVMVNASGALDANGTREQYEALLEVIPPEWLTSAATGSPEQCAATVLRQFDLGADSVILHGATPAELEPVLAAYRAVRPEGPFDDLPVNPGWSPGRAAR